MSTILNRGIKLFNLYNCLGILTWAQKMEVHGANRYTTDGSKGNHSELLLTYCQLYKLIPRFIIVDIKRITNVLRFQDKSLGQANPTPKLWLGRSSRAFH